VCSLSSAGVVYLPTKRPSAAASSSACEACVDDTTDVKRRGWNRPSRVSFSGSCDSVAEKSSFCTVRAGRISDAATSGSAPPPLRPTACQVI